MAGGHLRRVAARLGLTLASLALTLASLELAARLLTPSFLVQEREGVFASLLPLVNGRSAEIQVLQLGPPLPVAAEAGELRVATFGESSMEGAPWGHAASPATQLGGLLAGALPGRRVTVLNLGRTSSFALDTWYYLVGTARYRPDVVVFYLGMNDRYDLDREACLPATHPTLHGAWRWMVERSRLLWLTRVYLPRLAGGPGSGADVTGSEREQPLRCDPDRAFQAWTDVLVETATRHGARVVVATPVFSCLAPLDRDFAGAHRGVAPGEALASADGPYRRALACLLAAGCDLGAVDLGPDGLGGLVEAGLRVVAAAASPALVKPPDELRGAAWKRSAAAFGATLVDFAAALRAISPGHRLGPPHLVDSVHLSPTAYGLLARQVARAILDGQRSGPGAATGPVASLPDGAGEPVLAVQDPTEVALTYARARQFLTAAILAGQPAAAANPRARLLLGWLRRGLGGPSGLDAADEAGLEDFAAGAGLVRGAASPAR